MDLYNKCLQLKKVTPCSYKECSIDIVNNDWPNTIDSNLVMFDKSNIDKNTSLETLVDKSLFDEKCNIPQGQMSIYDLLN